MFWVSSVHIVYVFYDRFEFHLIHLNLLNCETRVELFWVIRLEENDKEEVVQFENWDNYVIFREVLSIPCRLSSQVLLLIFRMSRVSEQFIAHKLSQV